MSKAVERRLKAPIVQKNVKHNRANATARRKASDE